MHDPATLQAGVQLKKVGPAAENAKPAPAPEAGGRFVPNPADLMKLRAGLRKTAPAAEEPTQHAEQPAEAEKPAQVAEEAAPALAEEPATAAADEAAPMEDVDAEQAAAEPQPAAVEEPAAAAEPEPAADVAMPEAPTQPTPEPEVAVPAPAPAEEAAAADSALPKGRKSVRFHVDSAAAAGTPEGAARDATITIRLRKGDLEQVGVLGVRRPCLLSIAPACCPSHLLPTPARPSIHSARLNLHLLCTLTTTDHQRG